MAVLKKLVVMLAFGVAGAMASAAESPDVLRVCLNEVAHPPWRSADATGRVVRSGLDFIFLDLLAQRANLRMQISLYPWRRCLADLKSGEQDAILSISHLPEREELGVFPTRQGQPDLGLALRYNEYHFYVVQGSKLRWTGQQLQGLGAEDRVGVQSGYSIGSVLRDQGLKIDEGARSAQANLEMMLRGRVAAVALQTNEADRVLGLNPDMARRIRKLQPVIQVRAYFTVFSHPYWQRDPTRVLRLWRDIAAVRDSKAYRQAEEQALREMKPEN